MADIFDTIDTNVVVNNKTDNKKGDIFDQVTLTNNAPQNRINKPTLWSKLGAEITPAMRQSNPYLSAIAQTGQDIATIPAHYINQLALNLPRSAVNAMGATYPETTNPVANVAAKAAGVAGLVTNPISQGLQTVFKAPITLGEKALQGGVIGGLGGAAYSPTEDIVGVKQRTEQGLLGAVTGSIGMVANNFPKLINFGGRKTAQAIAEKADKGIESLSQSLSSKYDDLFSNIKAKIPTKDIIPDIQNTIDEFPEGANIGKFKSIINRLKDNEEISATDLFNIKKEISKTIPKSVWNGVSDSDAITNSKMNLYWNISKKLEEVGGEKYAGLTDEYKQFKQAERLAKRMFFEQGVPTNPSIGKAVGGYNIPTERATRYLSSKLPKEQQFAQDFEAWRRGQITKGATMGGTGVYMLHRYLTDKLLRRD